MDIEVAGDVTGQISDCIKTLLQVGFDASAFETAKWAGVACLIALALSAALTFVFRLRRDADVLPPVTESQFRWLLYVGAILIALPVVAKITTDNTQISFASSDRSFAQQTCRDQAQAFAQQAEIGGLEAKVTVLQDSVNALRARVDQGPGVEPGTGPDVGDPLAMVETQIVPEILGVPVSIYYRSARADMADEVRTILSDAGAGVAARSSDLSETSRADTALAGEIYVLADPRAGDAPGAISDVLERNGITVQNITNVARLSGTPVQILLY